MQLDTEDWFVVDFDSNPVPGDEARIRELAKAYMDRRDNFNDMARILRDMERNDSTLQGQWVEKFREKTKNLPKDLEQFADGFETVRDALSGWANLLPDYQQRAYNALVEAKRLKANIGALQQSQEQARDDLNQTKDRVDQAKRHYQDNLDDDQALIDYSLARSAESAAMTMLADYTSQLSTAEEDLAKAKRAVRTVSEEYQTEGAAVARRIDGAVGETPHFSTFQWVFYSDAWQITVKVLEIAGTLLAIAGLFIGGWVIALVTAAVAAALFINKLLEWTQGDATGGEVLLEALFTALTVLPGVRAIRSGIRGARGAEAAFEVTDLAKGIGRYSSSMGKALSGKTKALFSGGVWSSLKKFGGKVGKEGAWDAMKEFGGRVARSSAKDFSALKKSWSASSRHLRISYLQLKNGWKMGGLSGLGQATGKQLNGYLLKAAQSSDEFGKLYDSVGRTYKKLAQYKIQPDAGILKNVQDFARFSFDVADRNHLWKHSLPYVTFGVEFIKDGKPNSAIQDYVLEYSAEDFLSGALSSIHERVVKTIHD